MIDFTEICSSVPQKASEIVHKSITTPYLIISFIMFCLVFLIVGLIIVHMKSKNKPAKFFWVWISSVLISGIFLGFLIASPNTMDKFIDLISKLWS